MKTLLNLVNSMLIGLFLYLFTIALVFCFYACHYKPLLAAIVGILCITLAIFFRRIGVPRKVDNVEQLNVLYKDCKHVSKQLFLGLSVFYVAALVACFLFTFTGKKAPVETLYKQVTELEKNADTDILSDYYWVLGCLPTVQYNSVYDLIQATNNLVGTIGAYEEITYAYAEVDDLPKELIDDYKVSVEHAKQNVDYCYDDLKETKWAIYAQIALYCALGILKGFIDRVATYRKCLKEFK